MALEFGKLLELMIEKKAVELRLSVGEPPCLRLRGGLRPLALPPVDADDILRYVNAIAPEIFRREFEEKGVCAFDIACGPKARVFVKGSRERIEARLIPNRAPALLELDRRLAKRLDMPLEPYSSDPRLTAPVLRFVASFGLVVRTSRGRIRATYRGRTYERPVGRDADAPAEVCRFILDILDGRAA